jgi:hypothetical protein
LAAVPLEAENTATDAVIKHSRQTMRDVSTAAKYSHRINKTVKKLSAQFSQICTRYSQNFVYLFTVSFHFI